MVRRYDDPIEVRATADAPQSFLWHGRLYVVREILAQWQERRAWWRDESGRSHAGAPERRVWRVEASRGRALGSGVFELGCDASAWTLLRAED
ncbi:MAG: DUF6504 family protein [Micrococcales bacterium]|nr:DUF6504 family protein [Micrococcales bacterium]